MTSCSLAILVDEHSYDYANVSVHDNSHDHRHVSVGKRALVDDTHDLAHTLVYTIVIYFMIIYTFQLMNIHLS